MAIFMGDLNVDAENDPKEYEETSRILSSAVPHGHFADAYYEQNGYHPITYGDVCAQGMPKETALTAPMDQSSKMCLDYIFLFRGKASERGYEQKKLWSDGQITQNQKEEVEKSVIPSPWEVGEVKVKPFFVDKHQAAVPITQLSDHYGLSVTLKHKKGSDSQGS